MDRFATSVISRPSVEGADLVAGKLPAYDDDAVVSINPWAKCKSPAEIQSLRPALKRFLLYYWFAIDVFGAVERTKLPDCIIAAVRSKYPNPPGVAYIGHIDVE
jgi:hypothetical protein